MTSPERVERRPLGRTGLTVSALCVCPGDGAEREAVARRARIAGCALFGADRTLEEGAMVLPGDLNGSSYGMVRYNLLEQTEAHSVLPRLAREGRGVLAVGVLAGGRLAGPAPAADPRARAFDFLARRGRTRAQAALQFVLANESVSSALVRVSTVAHLEELLGAFAAPPLSGRELEQIFETWANRHDPGP
jgi:hypothetical protein